MVDVLTAALADATHVSVAVAFVRMSGLHLLLPALNAARHRGAHIRVLTSTYLDTTEPQALRSLLSLAGVELRVQDGAQGFHAKVHLLVRRHDKVGWIGSSNWSRSGLRDNLEWNTLIDDPRRFEEAWRSFDELWRRDDARLPDEAFLARCRMRLTRSSGSSSPTCSTRASTCLRSTL